MRFYKRDPDAALVGMAGLTDEQYRAYNVVIDLLYSRDGDAPSDRVVCTHLRWNVQRWRRVRNELLELGKFHIKVDGKLTANRVEVTIKSAKSFSEVQRKKANSRWNSMDGECQDGNALIAIATIKNKKEEVPGVKEYAFSSGVIRLTETDFRKWKEAFTHLDLSAELYSLADWAGKQKNWFIAVSGALAKRNREIGLRKEQARASGGFRYMSGIEGVI